MDNNSSNNSNNSSNNSNNSSNNSNSSHNSSNTSNSSSNNSSNSSNNSDNSSTNSSNGPSRCSKRLALLRPPSPHRPTIAPLAAACPSPGRNSLPMRCESPCSTHKLQAWG